MVEYLKLILIIVFLLVVLRRILNFIYWIQVKEYRFDRFCVFIKSKEGKRLLELYNWFFEIVLIIFSYLWKEFITILILYFIYQNFKLVLEILRKEVRKPVFTQRIYLILITSLLFTIASLVFVKNLFIFCLILETVTLAGIIAGVVWTRIIVNRIKVRDIACAKKKLLKIKPLVVGITGSYGKTSTKEFLSAILNSHAKTISTVKNENTEFGVTRMVIDKLQKGTKFFVVEMGAYKKSEISAICKIVHPDIGVITGIEPQHLALFKNMQILKQAKFELIEALPKNGLAFFNYSNKFCQELAYKARQLSSKLKISSYALADNNNPTTSVDCLANIIRQTIKGIDFEIQINSRREKFYAPVHGRHFIENLTGAIIVSYKLGVPLQKIKKVCSNLETLSGTMALKKIRGGSYLIDDSYNATPRGFESALNYLNLFKGFQKIVVTPGIIELGEKSKEIHHELGKLLTNVDNIFLTNDEFRKDLLEGLGKDGYKLQVIGRSFKNQEDYFRELLKTHKFVLLIEGRIPIKTLDTLIQ